MDLPPETLAEAKVVLASFMGGAVRLFLRPASSIAKSAFMVVCCMVCGYYFTPVAMDVANFDESWTGAMGALIGLVGLSVAEAALKIKWSYILARGRI